MTCIWSSWCYCHLIIISKILNGLSFCYHITLVVPEKRPPNECCSSCTFATVNMLFDDMAPLHPRTLRRFTNVLLLLLLLWTPPFCEPAVKVKFYEFFYCHCASMVYALPCPCVCRFIFCLPQVFLAHNKCDIFTHESERTREISLTSREIWACLLRVVAEVTVWGFGRGTSTAFSALTLLVGSY